MGRTIHHPEHGLVYERAFKLGRPSAESEEVLAHALRERLILSYQMAGDQVVVQRPYVEAQSLLTLFEHAVPVDRERFAVDTFRRALDFLDRLEANDCFHGAPHPGNMLLGAEGLQLVDAMCNAIALGCPASPEAEARYAIWMWSQTRSPEMQPGVWDFLNLVRVCSLLASGPDAWKTPRPRWEVIKDVRRWSDIAMQALAPGTDASRRLAELMDSLDSLVDVASKTRPVEKPPSRGQSMVGKPRERTPAAAPAPSPPSPSQSPAALVAQTMKAALGASADSGRVIEESLEQTVSDACVAAGHPADAVRVAIDIWLQRNQAVRGDDLRARIVQILEAGLEHRIWVKSAAIKNAVRTYQRYGVAADRAGVLTAHVVEESGFRDASQAHARWGVPVDAYLQQHCAKKKKYSKRDFAALLEMVRHEGLPDEMATAALRHHLQRQGYQAGGGLWPFG